MYKKIKSYAILDGNPLYLLLIASVGILTTFIIADFSDCPKNENFWLLNTGPLNLIWVTLAVLILEFSTSSLIGGLNLGIYSFFLLLSSMIYGSYTKFKAGETPVETFNQVILYNLRGWLIISIVGSVVIAVGIILISVYSDAMRKYRGLPTREDFDIFR